MEYSSSILFTTKHSHRTVFLERGWMLYKHTSIGLWPNPIWPSLVMFWQCKVLLVSLLIRLPSHISGMLLLRARSVACAPAAPRGSASLGKLAVGQDSSGLSGVGQLGREWKCAAGGGWRQQMHIPNPIPPFSPPLSFHGLMPATCILKS